MGVRLPSRDEHRLPLRRSNSLEPRALTHGKTLPEHFGGSRSLTHRTRYQSTWNACVPNAQRFGRLTWRSSTLRPPLTGGALTVHRR